MDKTQKIIQIIILGVLIVAIGVFSFLMYSWNFAYSKGTYSDEHGIYTGEFKGKSFNGNGTFVFESGVKYTGEWKNGVMEGYGEIIFLNGSRYEGDFVDGHFEGNGKITTEKGKIIKGVFRQGYLVK